MTQAPGPGTVHTLTCKRDLAMALTCLGTLRRALPASTVLRIHDDGSLAPEDFARLAAALPNSVAVPRRSLDESVETKLARHPRCLAYRKEHAFSCKLLDIPLGTSLDPIYYCDSDILFLRRPRCWISPDGEPIFSVDPTDGYSGPLWKLRYGLGLKLPSRFNAGIFCAPRRVYDLDFLEWFLGKPEARMVPWLVEQTAWAGLVRGKPIWMYDPEQLRNGPPAEGAEEDSTLAIHFMTPVRHHLPRFAAKAEAMPELPAGEGFRFVKSETLGLKRILARPLRRWTQRWRG